MHSICVFCGSSAGNDPAYAAVAESLGRTLAERGIHLVFGGASVGLMGILADSALSAGGRVTGIIPSFFSKKEIAHKGLTDLIFSDSMHERKQVMARLSDGFIAMPGGFGTLDEFFEALTWSQLDLHKKPVGLLNIKGYYDHLLAFFDTMEQKALLKPLHRKMILCSDDINTLLQMMVDYRPLSQDKWIRSIKEELF